MKQVNFYILFLIIGFNFSTKAQNSFQVVRGTIKDNISESPIPGAKIFILNNDDDLRVMSDLDGNFKLINVPIGRQDILITYLGYEDVLLKGVSIEAGKEKILNIKMVESFNETEKVVIKARKDTPINEMSIVSTRTFSVEETQKYAASFNDPARMATSFPGVVSTGGINNDISIRGNSPRGLIWRMEGVEIPNPNHFSNAGTSGGGISIISSQLLGTSDFSIGAFAAEYGNALSGVFDLSLRKGNNEKREYTIQAGLLGIDAAFEGPFKKGYDGSYLINYRYSTLGMLQHIVPLGDNAINFQDLSFNIYLPTDKIGNFGIFGLGGLSSESFQAKKDTLAWIENEESRYEGVFKANTGVLGLWHKVRISNKGFIKTNFAYSSTENGYFDDSLNLNFDKTRRYNESFLQSRFTISSNYTQKLTSKTNFKTGIIFNQIGFKFKQQILESGAMKNLISENGSTNTAQAYFQLNHQFSKKITTNFGVHYLQLFLNNSNNIEPRASISYKLSPKNTLNIGYGLHSQIQPLGTYFAQTTNDQGAITTPNHDLGLNKAHHFVISHKTALTNNLNLKTEVYYQNLFNVPISDEENQTYSLINSSGGYETIALSSNGKGKNYGLELSLERSLKNNLYYLISGSLYESKFQAKNNTWYNTQYNTNYTFSLTGGKEWVLKNPEKRRTLGFNVKSTFTGGMRYTEYDLSKINSEGYPKRDYQNAYAAQMPAYSRIDIRISLQRDYDNVTSTISLDVQNILNKQNVAGQYFDIETGLAKYYFHPGLMPIISYRLTF